MINQAEEVPTGVQSGDVQDYYDFLYTEYLDRAQSQPWDIDWGGTPLQLYATGTLLIVFFFVFARYFNHVRRERDELYAPVSFAGILYERAGKVSLFSVVVWVGTTAAGLYYVIDHALNGQVY